MEKTIAVIDYGVGNLSSVTKALEYLGLKGQITSDPGQIERSNAIILPGVGAFPDAAAKLFDSGLDRVIVNQSEKKPVLGICLGMQLLFEESSEIRVTKGLGLIPGVIRKIPTEFKLPHIGWNSLEPAGDHPLIKQIRTGDHVYFVHSYCAVTPAENVVAVTDYGSKVTAMVGRGNVYGCQFHPEKSGETGLQILRNFGELCQ